MSVPRPKRYALIALLLLIGLALSGLTGVGAAPREQQPELVVLYFFWGEGCPHCELQKPFLEELAQRHDHLVVRSYEVYHSLDNRALLLEMASALGFSVSGVPTTIVGERYWVGFSDAVAQQIEEHVVECGVAGCPDLGAGLVAEQAEPAQVDPTPDSSVEADADAPDAAPVTSDASRPILLYFFWGEGCPYCEMQKPFLDELLDDYPGLTVRSYEVYHAPENLALLQNMAARAGFDVRGVPVTFVGDRYWIGYSDVVAQQIHAQVKECAASDCIDAAAGLVGEIQDPAPQPAPDVDPADDDPAPVFTDPSGPAAPTDPIWRPDILTIPLIGTVDLGAQSLALSTALIAFMDGFNPCSLWVVSILLSLVLRTGSRTKILIIGASFLSVTALVYSLFIAGLFSVFAFIGYMGWIQVVVAMIALFFAGINIKDYFWYKEGVSLTISDEHKPGLYRKMRGILRAESIGGMILATVVMAAGAALVELPCTAGFPMLWTSLVAGQGVTGLNFGLLLGLYIAMYLLIEVVLFVGAVVTLRSSKLQETHGRVLKLFGGTLMLTLALVMLIDPNMMNDISSTLVIFGAAIVVALVALVIHRVLLPFLGVRIGTGLRPRRR